ncbi:FAS1 domain [Sesbania bispinosa]|nr:FAS1 domain [Sesbania bispinosa]
MKTQHSLFSASVLLLALTLFYFTTTISAQISPVQAPVASPPAPPLPQSPPLSPLSPPAATAPAPGFNSSPCACDTKWSPYPVVPKAPSIDIVQILRKAKRFSVLIRLLKTTQLINQLNSQLVTSGSGGLTLFAPEDSAFSKLKAGFLNSLSDRQKVELLQFHTLSSFISISNFDTLTNPVQTQAGDDPKRLQLNVTTYGGSQVSMTTGAVNATVTGTAPAPAPAAAKGGAPKTDKTKPSSSSDEGGDDSDGGNKALPAEASAAGSVSLNGEGMWVALILGVVALVGEAIM